VRFLSTFTLTRGRFVVGGSGNWSSTADTTSVSDFHSERFFPDPSPLCSYVAHLACSVLGNPAG
jgi:hypothetical protein